MLPAVTPHGPEVGKPDGSSADEGLVLEWACHPVKRRPLVSVGVSLFIVVVVVLVFFATGSGWFTLLAILILLGSLAKFYLPTRYRLSDRRITVRTTTQTLHKDWSLYRSCWPDKNGVLLSPFEGQSRLENFRGLYLMFEGNADQVVAFVKERIGRAPAAGQSAEGATS